MPSWANQYDAVRSSEDVFIVSKGKKMGLANAKGTLLTKLVFDTLYNFQEGIAIAGQGRRDVNQFGKVLSDFKYGYLNKAGHLIVPMNYEYISPFSEGLGLVMLRYAYLFINKKGQVALRPSPVYNCFPFRGNTAYVEVPNIGFWLPPYMDGRNNGPHKQLYDINGETIYGNYIDRKGRLLIPWQYDTIAPYTPGYVRAVRKAGKWGFLDSLAVIKVPLQYTDIDQDSAFFWQELRRVGINGHFGFMNPHTGESVISLRYEATKPSQTALVWVQLHNRWGCINRLGRVVIPFAFTDARPFGQGVSIVQKGHRWGLIDTTGRILTPIQYDEIFPFQEARAIIKTNGKAGFLNLDGQVIIPATFSQVSHFKNGYAYAKKWGLFIKLDRQGDWVTVKLQSATLYWLTVVAGLLLLATLLWYRQQQRIRRNMIA